jgi:hypothetical protein
MGVGIRQAAGKAYRGGDAPRGGTGHRRGVLEADED